MEGFSMNTGSRISIALAAAALVAAVSLAPGQARAADATWKPTLVDKKGESKAFPDNPATIEINPEKESKDIGVGAGVLGHGVLGVGSIGISGKVAFCRLNVRVINSATGEIVQDLTADGTAKSSGMGIGGGLIGRLGGGAL